MNEQKNTLPKKISLAEVQTDLKSIEFELKEVTTLKTTKERIIWARANPQKYQKIWHVYMKYEIQKAIETLEELLNLVEERFGNEKRNAELVIRRTPIHRDW